MFFLIFLLINNAIQANLTNLNDVNDINQIELCKKMQSNEKNINNFVENLSDDEESAFKAFQQMHEDPKIINESKKINQKRREKLWEIFTTRFDSYLLASGKWTSENINRLFHGFNSEKIFVLRKLQVLEKKIYWENANRYMKARIQLLADALERYNYIEMEYIKKPIIAKEIKL